MAYRIHSIPQIANLETAISDFNGEKIKFLLSRFRKSRNEFYHEVLYGII